MRKKIWKKQSRKRAWQKEKQNLELWSQQQSIKTDPRTKTNTGLKAGPGTKHRNQRNKGQAGTVPLTHKNTKTSPGIKGMRTEKKATSSKFQPRMATESVVKE